MTARGPAVLLAALGVACLPPPGSTTDRDDGDVSADRFETRPCEGATAIPPAVDELLTQLASPVRDHCEHHRLGGAPVLFVRTMNSVAHDDRGDPLPACRWEVFRVAPGPVRHLGTLSTCRFRVAGRCAVALADTTRAPPVCAE